MEENKVSPFPLLTNLVGALIKDSGSDVKALSRLATELALLSRTVVLAAGEMAPPEERDALYHLRLGAINEGVDQIMMTLRKALKEKEA